MWSNFWSAIFGTMALQRDDGLTISGRWSLIWGRWSWIFKTHFKARVQLFMAETAKSKVSRQIPLFFPRFWNSLIFSNNDWKFKQNTIKNNANLNWFVQNTSAYLWGKLGRERQCQSEETRCWLEWRCAARNSSQGVMSLTVKLQWKL